MPHGIPATTGGFEMKHAWMFLSGLGLAYLALRFGDQIYLQKLEPWVPMVITIVGAVAVLVAIAFFVINNTMLRNDRRIVGFSNAGLFWAMSAVVAGAFAYGAIVQPVFHQWGIEPWKWVGKGDAWENVALYAIGLLIVLILQHFWIAGIAYMRSIYKKADPYIANQQRIYTLLDRLGKTVEDVGAVAARCLAAIQEHDKTAGGKVTYLKDVALPPIAVGIDALSADLKNLTEMVSKRLPPPIHAVETDRDEAAAAASPRRTIA